MNDIDRKIELFRETYVRGAGDAGETDISGREKESGEAAAAEKTVVDAGFMDSVGDVDAAGGLEENRTVPVRNTGRAEVQTEGRMPDRNAFFTEVSAETGRNGKQEAAASEISGGKSEVPAERKIPAGQTEDFLRSEKPEPEDEARTAEDRSVSVAASDGAGVTMEDATEGSVTEIAPDGGDRYGEDTSERKENSASRETLPDFALMPASAQNPAKLIPADGDLRSSRLRITELYRRKLPVMIIEEDVLVPDVEPDLEQIINIDARPEITSHDIYQAPNGRNMYRIGGTVSVSTLYVPVADSGELVSITSQIRFRRECETGEEEESGETRRESPEAEISVELLSVGAKVINERKIRVRAEIRCTAKKYVQEETEFLEGVKDSELSLKKETIRFTDIAQRRTDTMDVSGEVIFKDNMPEAEKILHYDVNVVEVRRQIGKGKAVVDACAYYSILYLPKSDVSETGRTGEFAGERETGTEESGGSVPSFYRGKMEFTQFIRLPDVTGAGASDSQVSFDVISSDLRFEEPEDGEGERRLMLSFTVAAAIDVFRDMEREIVTDMYHRSRDVDFSAVPRRVSELCGSGNAEVSVREIITLPESKKGFGRVPYISASIEGLEASAENGRCRIEGTIVTNTVYEAESEEAGFSSFSEKLPFRTVIDIPDVKEGMTIDCSCGMKDIWFDRMNARQTEFSCTLAVSVYAWKVEEYRFIDKVCYIERDEDTEENAGMVVYVTRPGDTQWSIAKEFRTTTRELQLINGLEDSDYVEAGRKLLIL